MIRLARTVRCRHGYRRQRRLALTWQRPPRTWRILLSVPLERSVEREPATNLRAYLS